MDLKDAAEKHGGQAQGLGQGPGWPPPVSGPSSLLSVEGPLRLQPSEVEPPGGGGRWEIEAALMKSTKKIFCIMENTKAPSQISEII